MTSSKLSIFGNRFTNGFKGFLVSLTEALGELWSNEHSQGQIWGLVAGLCVSFMLWIVWSVAYMGVSKNRRKTPKWMVKIMVPNPMNKWMIWGVKTTPIFGRPPICSIKLWLFLLSGIPKKGKINFSLLELTDWYTKISKTTVTWIASSYAKSIACGMCFQIFQPVFDKQLES